MALKERFVDRDVLESEDPLAAFELEHAVDQIGEEEAAGILRDLWKTLGLGRTCSYVAGVSWTEGRVLRSADVWAMAEGWHGTPVGQALATAKPETIPFDRIPGEATSFAFQAGMDVTPIVKAVITALIQSERYGTPLGHAMRVMAQENRDLRMAAAEKMAAALPPKLTVPMITFFLPVLFIVILGPSAIKLMNL